MKIAIIGAGIAGLTTAHALASEGHEVTVLERRASAAEEGSFAHAGLAGPAFAALGLPPVQRRWPTGLANLGWLLRQRLQRKGKRALHQRAAAAALARHSALRMEELRERLGLDHERGTGLLVLLRSPRAERQAQATVELLRTVGVACETLKPDQARRIEPALSADTPLHAALHFAGEPFANSRQFGLLLRADAERMGARFEFNKTVSHLDPARPTTLVMALRQSVREFDAVVVCAGAASAALLRPLGIRIPLAMLYGYAVSAPVREYLNAPRNCALHDLRDGISISRLGHWVRVSGLAEIGGTPVRRHKDALEKLYRNLQDWYPGAAQIGKLQQWKGACAALPDGLPVLGASGLPGLWLNLGHGNAGWAQSCASASALADLIGQRAPALDLAPYRLQR